MPNRSRKPPKKVCIKKPGYKQELVAGMRVFYTRLGVPDEILRGRIMSVHTHSCIVWQDGVYDRNVLVGRERILEAYMDFRFPADVDELQEIAEVTEDNPIALPDIQSKWKHKGDGTEVNVVMIANYPPSDGYATTVVFRDWRDRTKSRKVSTFYKEYEEIRNGA